MPVVNKHRLQNAIAILLEDGLSIVGVPRAHVQKPGQPKVNSIPNASKTVTGQNLE
jgi:hypothetical protein